MRLDAGGGPALRAWPRLACELRPSPDAIHFVDTIVDDAYWLPELGHATSYQCRRQ